MRTIHTAVTVLMAALLACPMMPAQAGPLAEDAAVAAPANAAGLVGPIAAADVKAGAASRSANNPFGTAAVAVPSDKLDGVRGGAELVVSDMRLHGTVADNAAIHTLTGSNMITEGAFANAAGIPMAIQNSGNNVLIQNATIVNVQFK